MKRVFFDAVTYSALFLFGLFILYHLGLIWKIGTVFIFEGNKTLLASETTFMVGITLLGLVRLVLFLKDILQTPTNKEQIQ